MGFLLGVPSQLVNFDLLPKVFQVIDLKGRKKFWDNSLLSKFLCLWTSFETLHNELEVWKSYVRLVLTMSFWSIFSVLWVSENFSATFVISLINNVIELKRFIWRLSRILRCRKGFINSFLLTHLNWSYKILV